MKLYIRRKQPVMAMAYSRDTIQSKAKFYRSAITDHIMKCVIYSKNYRDYNHWVEDELSSWFN